MQQQTTCCGLKRGPKVSEPVHNLPLERFLRAGYNPSHLNSIAESFDFEMFFTHNNIWPDGMDFLTMIKAPGCTQSKCIHGMKQRWSRAWDAIYSHSNLRCWEYAFWKHISTNLWEMSWKNSAKQCDNVHRAGKYSDILDYAISMSYIGCATLYSTLPTWQEGWVVHPATYLIAPSTFRNFMSRYSPEASKRVCRWVQCVLNRGKSPCTARDMPKGFGTTFY